MELFCLGVRDDKGRFCYSENEVKHLAKSFTGWTINEQDPDNPKSVFVSSRWSNGSRAVQHPRQLQGVPPRRPGLPAGDDAVELMLKRPARPGVAADARKPYETHARFLLTKLWHEFIVATPTRPR